MLTENGFTWGLIVAPIMAVQIFIVALQWAPDQFWLGLEERHPRLAWWLWGFSLHKVGTFPTEDEEEEIE